MYSIAETAKANGLNPYWYMKHVLEEMLKHQNDKDDSYLDKLLPWSESLPDICHKPKKAVPAEAVKKPGRRFGGLKFGRVGTFYHLQRN